jgi:hypothetical protein
VLSRGTTDLAIRCSISLTIFQKSEQGAAFSCSTLHKLFMKPEAGNLPADSQARSWSKSNYIPMGECLFLKRAALDSYSNLS